MKTRTTYKTPAELIIAIAEAANVELEEGELNLALELGFCEPYERTYNVRGEEIAIWRINAEEFAIEVSEMKKRRNEL